VRDGSTEFFRQSFSEWSFETSILLCNIFGSDGFLDRKCYPCDVKNSSASYQRFTKVTAALLLMAFLIPTGLHAKDLVEFCKMEFGSVPAETAGIPADEMKAGHSCCESGDEEPSQDHAHHDCEWDLFAPAPSVKAH
jgi:hypothetical protein